MLEFLHVQLDGGRNGIVCWAVDDHDGHQAQFVCCSFLLRLVIDLMEKLSTKYQEIKKNNNML